MPHFMVRRQINGHQHFSNRSQTGKRFFYHLDNQAFPVDDNIVINSEVNFKLSCVEFQELIKNITGNQNPTTPHFNTTNNRQYNYHLSKNAGFIDVNYCINTLRLPNSINGYNLAKIGIAANYDNHKADGNILLIFCDQNNQNNEVCISIHIKYSNKNTNYLPRLVHQLANIVNNLDPQNNFFWQLNPWDNFNSLGYTVTSGHTEEANYKNAYNASINAVASLFNELPNLSIY